MPVTLDFGTLGAWPELTFRNNLLGMEFRKVNFRGASYGS